MKNKELFDRTVSILVKAYQNDTLTYDDCAKCAVGNLVAANNIGWAGGWASIINCGEGTFNPLKDEYFQPAIKKLKSTGYGFQELADIEKSFFIGTHYVGGVEVIYNNKDEENFKGLMSVIDTLMQIHEATTEEATQAKELFVKIDC